VREQFDELSKALASGVPRRVALRRFIGGVAAVMAAGMLPGRAAEAQIPDKAMRDCVACCRDNFGRPLAVNAGPPPGQIAPFDECVRTCVEVFTSGKPRVNGTNGTNGFYFCVGQG
jgi:hypothetical protein